MEISTLAAYHCLAFVWYFFIAYSITHLRTEERPSEVFHYGGQWKYLTVLNLAVFYGVSFLADVLRLIKKLRCAKSVISSRDLLFSALAFPLSTFVSISFWTLYTYNRELVYPKSLDGVIPLWLNHAVKGWLTQKGILLIFEGGQILQTTWVSLFAFLLSLIQGLCLIFHFCLSRIIVFYHLYTKLG